MVNPCSGKIHWSMNTAYTTIASRALRWITGLSVFNGVWFGATVALKVCDVYTTHRSMELYMSWTQKGKSTSVRAQGKHAKTVRTTPTCCWFGSSSNIMMIAEVASLCGCKSISWVLRDLLTTARMHQAKLIITGNLRKRIVVHRHEVLKWW